MSTFYGYAERQAEDQLDWSVIGKEITTMLQTEVTRRDKLKADIDKESRKYGETLANAPTGQHKGASDGVLEFASNLEQARLVQDRLLKSGQLKVKDYLQQRQNLTDGTTGLFAAAKEFQAAYAGKLKKMTEGTASAAEIHLFEMTEAFGNWNKVGAYINPTNYQVSLGKKHRVKQADGSYVYEMGDKPDEYFTVNELRNFISLDIPRYDTKGALDKAAESLGKRDLTITFPTEKDGQKGTRTLKVSDITGEVLEKLKAKKLLTEDQINLIDKYHDYQDAIVDDITANPYNALSVLTDYVGVAENGKKFEYVWSEEAAKGRPEAVYFEKDPQAGAPRIIFHDNQEKYIKGKLKQGLDQRLDQTVTDTFTPDQKKGGGSYKPPSEGSRAATTSVRDMWSSWIKPLFTGSENEIVDSLSRLANLKKDVKEARLFKNSDGSTSLIYERYAGDNVEVFRVSEQDLAGGKITGDVLRKITGSIFYNDYIPLVAKDKSTEYNRVIDSANLGDISMVNYRVMPSMVEGGKITSRKKKLNYVPDLLTGGKKDAEGKTFYDSFGEKLTDIENVNDSKAMAKAIEKSFQRLPATAKSMDQNPFNKNNFKITKIISKDQTKQTTGVSDGKVTDSSGMVISLPSLGVPDLFIPVSSWYNAEVPDLMKFLEQKIRDEEKFTFEDVADIYSESGYYTNVLKFLKGYNTLHGSREVVEEEVDEPAGDKEGAASAFSDPNYDSMGDRE